MRQLLVAVSMLSFLPIAYPQAAAPGGCPSTINTNSVSPFHWPNGTTVYYTTQGLTTGQQAAVQAVFGPIDPTTGLGGTLNMANQKNGSGVSYVPADSTHPANYIIAGTPTVPPNAQPNTPACNPTSPAVAGTCPAYSATGATLVGLVSVYDANCTYLQNGVSTACTDPNNALWLCDYQSHWS
jgi:hypothetical protein